MSSTSPVRIRTLAVVAVIAVALAACGSSSKKTTTATTVAGGAATGVKIGFFGALTGPNAQLGINIDNGVKLAVDQHNKNSGAAQVQLLPYDSAGDPAQAPT